MSAPVQNNPPAQKRSRIVINLERALHLSPQGQQPYGAKRKRWPIVLGITGALLLALVVGGYFYWQHYKTKPAYALALAINAAQRADAPAFDEVFDTDKVVESFAPQMIDEAKGRFGTALTPAMQQKVEALIPTLLPRVKDSVRGEVMKHVREATARAEGKPFFLVALFISYYAEINQQGDAATVSAKANDRNVELTMQRGSDKRWRVVGVKDPVLAKRLVDDIATDLPAIGSNAIDEARKQIEKRLPGVLPGSGGKRR
ncbi:MAG TPA: hypothetical protein VEV81_09355 [Pyrinomonadaceae bacterium]|nr:hypothetical protein [Pyrinomonadaceae bacterium]